MSDWQRKLNLMPEWEQCGEDEITIQELAKVISDRLRALKPFGIEYIDDKCIEIADEFLALSEDAEAKKSDSDFIMNMLYDWADQHLDDDWAGKRVCWVETMWAQ